MKHVFLLMSVCVLALTGCFSGEQESQPLPERLAQTPEKRDVPPAFFSGSDVIPITDNAQRYLEVADWFDDQSILYITDEVEGSVVYRYQLLTGEQSLFFQVEEPIVAVSSNDAKSLFAIQTVTNEGDAPVYLVNEQGELQMKLEELGEDFSLYWNPYNEQELIAVAFLPDWEQDIYDIDVAARKIMPLNLNQSYLQWVNRDTIAYLEWDEFEPSFSAPLYSYDIETEEESLWLEDIIAFIGYGTDVSLTVSVSSPYDAYSLYRFYEGQEPVAELEVPILNTYSEQWWIPFHDFDEKNGIFYYLRPKENGDFFDYNQGYSLMAFNVENGSETHVMEIADHLPILVSPSGKWLLYGSSFETVIDLEEKLSTALF
ncbi:YqgU-like beta propeller domain-containing protein [Halalkalibacterium ligniniphilum]|uniref:YqgU-like beta propeller domain-containing protein n=1 Tax=Halalkalibacterium ligniniphilum TaxID=1134413 RepID=UPI000382E313|nr:hypothetical protein [Halalkalibacterium ligniniphilum]